MFRNRIFPILSSIVVFMMLIMMSDKLHHKLYPVPEKGDGEKEFFYLKYFNTLGNDAFLVLGIGWLAAAFISGLLCGRLSREYWFINSIMLGAIATVLVSMNLLLIPFHPLWFNILMPLLPLAMVYLGARVYGIK